MKKISRIIVILLVVVIGGALYWYFAISKQPASETTKTTAKPTPGVGFGSLRPYAKLCVKFQKTEAKISCEEAVERALMQTQGAVIRVSVESAQVPFLDTSPPQIRTINIWAVDIKLTNPLFYKEFNKEVRVLRIGIPVEGYKLIHKKPIE